MAGNNDFLALYQELGLRADCTLEEFKLAYRKRVGALHPDRGGGDEGGMQGLSRLNALYTRAMEFQRRHGRLPGAAQPVAIATTGPRVPPRPAAPASVRDVPAPARRSNRLPALLVLVAALVAAWLWANPVAFETAPAAVASAPPAPRVAPAGPAVVQTFALGTPAKSVRALQGAPLSGWEQHWDYGPSWVQFRCGVVTGWYSSPLRPLKVATSRPPDATPFELPRNCKE